MVVEIYYDGTEEIVQINDEVIWRYDTEEMIGEIIHLNSSSFSVRCQILEKKHIQSIISLD